MGSSLSANIYTAIPCSLSSGYLTWASHSHATGFSSLCRCTLSYFSGPVFNSYCTRGIHSATSLMILGVDIPFEMKDFDPVTA